MNTLTTTTRLDLDLDLQLYTLVELKQKYAEARAVAEEAGRAACRTTVEEGFTNEQAAWAGEQAQAAEYVKHLWWIRLEDFYRRLRAAEIEDVPYEASDSALLSEFSPEPDAYDGWEIQTPDGVYNL